MTRRISGSLIATIMSAVIGATAVPAMAQHNHGGGGFQGGGHYDYQPGHYDWHNGHRHYHPGDYYWHDPGHGGWNQPSYVQPSYVQPSYVQPTYGPSVQSTFYDETGHSHEHPTRTTRRINYGGFSHIDDIAIDLEQRANSLCLELHYNYQHNPGFNETYREAYEILTTAKYLHGLEHAGNHEKMRQVAGDLDGLFHHVERDVAHWTGHHHRHIGHGGLTAKLEDVEESLHHLMDDVGARPAGSGSESAPPALNSNDFRPVAPVGNVFPH